MADMESKADETRCMTLALSNLDSLIELGLSIDSGLGWIQGKVPFRADDFNSSVSSNVSGASCLH